MPKAKKSSLVENINRRKEAGISRPKSETTISKTSYKNMEEGWPAKKAAPSSEKKKAPGKAAR